MEEIAGGAASPAIAASAGRWCILRTSGAQTLPLADYLVRVGIEAWTPRRTFRRVLQAGKKGERKIDVPAPILPTFVFARAAHLVALAKLAADSTFPHPAFSIFRHLDRHGQGRHPLVADGSVQGLRDAEAAAADTLRLQLEADTHEAAEAIRRAALKTERERVKAARMDEAERRRVLRAERGDFAPGQQVTVDDVPAFTGVTGVVESTDGRTAVVAFGGGLTIKIEAWQLAHDPVQGP